jgi:hypothetical protein
MRHSSETIEGCRAEYIDCKTRGRSSPSSWDPHKDTNTNPSLCKTAQIRPLPVASELHPSGWNTWDRPVVGTIPLKSKTGWHTKDAHHIDPKVVTLETSWNTKPIWVLLFFCCGHGDEDHLFPESDTWNNTDVIISGTLPVTTVTQENNSYSHSGTFVTTYNKDCLWPLFSL